MDEVYVAKGRKVTHFDLRREKPSAAALAEVLLGPTGNLRAPALRRGKILLVGFNEEMYRQILG